MVAHSQLKALEHVAFNKKIPTMIVGAPGVGKSATIRDLSEKLGYTLIIILGSQIDGADVTGLPQSRVMGHTKPDSNGERKEIHGTVYSSPYWQVQILLKKKVVLFLDEYTNAPPSTRASILTLIQDRVFANGQKLPEETVVLGAMNPHEEAADGFELDLPTKNRFFFMDWDPPKSDWIEGVKTNWGKNNFTSEEKKWRRLVSNFIEDNPSLLHVQPKPDDAPSDTIAPTMSKREVLESAWPSRRSWDNLAKSVAGIDDVETQDLIIEGLVGHRASTEFRSWLRKNDTLSPQDVMDNPDSLDWKNIAVDDSNVLFREVTNQANNAQDRETIAKAIGVFNKAVEEGVPNLAAAHLSKFIKNTNFSRYDLKSEAISLASRYKTLGARK